MVKMKAVQQFHQTFTSFQQNELSLCQVKGVQSINVESIACLVNWKFSWNFHVKLVQHCSYSYQFYLELIFKQAPYTCMASVT